jgi:hypothetical protein
MFEGVNNNSVSENQEQPFDYLAEAARMREEREARDATEKAEREAKDKRKREEKLARQYARSAAKREEIEKKAQDLESSSKDAKDQLKDTKQEVENLRKEATSVIESNKQNENNVEMTATNGSEYIADLAEGESATLIFEHEIKELDGSIKKTEETITLADEVSAQALALARARDALLEVESSDMRTHASSGESGPIYDLGREQQELRDRIQHTWAHNEVAETPIVNSAITTTDELTLSSHKTDSDQTIMHPPSPESTVARYPEGTYSLDNGAIERAPDPVSPVTTSIKNGVAFVGGLFASGRTRASSLKRSIDRTNLRLSTETSAIKRDVETIQRQSNTNEYIIPEQMERSSLVATVPATKHEALAQMSQPEVSGTDAPAIPAWIRQIENDVKNGKAVELKKWQHDVLRVQHPELLRRYEKLDQAVKEEIRHQSKEVLSRQFSQPHEDTPLLLSAPGDLPRLASSSSMPAFMSSSYNEPVAPGYAYAAPLSPAVRTALTANAYIVIVVFGGILFGAALIAVFGF